MPHGQIDRVGEEGTEGMDDDIAMADSTIATGLSGLLRREKATADPFVMAAKGTTVSATAKANRDGSSAVESF
jgi:hypothetical protein